LVARKIAAFPELGLKLMGFLTKSPSKVGKILQGVPVLGLFSELPAIIQEKNPHLVILALPLSAHGQIEEILGTIKEEMVDIKIVPDFFRFMHLRGGIEEFDGLPIINLQESPMVGWNRLIKRGMDLFISSLLLVHFSPLMLLIALLVKLTSTGPVFYAQKRMGLDGRVFTMLKFRSMVHQAESASGPVWAVPDDARRTRFGRIIRNVSLDELPQLFNVLKGEMSLVGPRPERPEFIEDFRTKIPRYMLRHKMKAGITGWAQVNGWRGQTSLEKRIECDIYYIQNWSFLLDMKILLRTCWRGLVHRNAY
jgi:Undecaprenyl-phosphate glucose phosphotransferase